MGSYGIGVSRLVGAIIEAKYDDKNEIMKWPLSVAPYDIALIPMINKNDISALEKANNINSKLIKSNIDSIIDDTDENYSSKIKKMNLIGAPYQIVIGKKIAEKVQKKWDLEFNDPLNVVLGNEWNAGNLSYHLKSRPVWDGVVDKNKLDSYNKFICIDDICVGNK